MPLVAWIIAALAFAANMTNASILTTVRTHDDVVAVMANTDAQPETPGAIAFGAPANPGVDTVPHSSGGILSTHALVLGGLPMDESLVNAEPTTPQPLTGTAVDAMSQQAPRMQTGDEAKELVIREEPRPEISKRATLIGALAVLLLSVVCMGCRTVFQEMRRRRYRRMLG